MADPDSRTVSAYRALTDVRDAKRGAGDLLPGDDVLPGFSAPVVNW